MCFTTLSKAHLCFTLSKRTPVFHTIITRPNSFSHYYHNTQVFHISMMHTCASHNKHNAHLCFTSLSLRTPVFHSIIILYTCVARHYLDARLCFTSLSLRIHVFHITMMHTYASHNKHTAHLSFTSLSKCTPVFRIIIIMRGCFKPLS